MAKRLAPRPSTDSLGTLAPLRERDTVSREGAKAPSGEMAEALPEGWVWTRMDDAGRWCTGGTPSRKVEAYFGGDVPWVKSGDLNDGILTGTEERLTHEGLANCAARIMPRGTVTIALYGATIGKLAILDIEAATNQACANCAVDARFFDLRYVFFSTCCRNGVLWSRPDRAEHSQT